MMGANSIFLDTNILIYLTDPASPWHEIAFSTVQKLRAEPTQLVISYQILREFLAVATKIVVTQRKGELEDIVVNIQTFREEFLVLQETDLVFNTLISITNRVAVAGKQIHDANIVATMYVHGINRLLTHNAKDFARFASYINVIPLVQNVHLSQ